MTRVDNVSPNKWFTSKILQHLMMIRGYLSSYCPPQYKVTMGELWMLQIYFYAGYHIHLGLPTWEWEEYDLKMMSARVQTRVQLTLGPPLVSSPHIPPSCNIRLSQQSLNMANLIKKGLIKYKGGKTKEVRKGQTLN